MIHPKTLTALTLLVIGCGDESRPGERAEGALPDTAAASADSASLATSAVRCSAAPLDPSLAESAPEPDGLPPGVAGTRRSMLEAALACDYERLEALALAGGSEFVYSFGDGNRPALFWRELEALEQEPLAMLVRTLSLPWARETLQVEPHLYYVWPSAYVIGAREADWRALAPLYSPEEIATFRDYGSFIGWRVGITGDGDWRFFVAGD